MTTTPTLGITHLTTSQSNKYLTVNQALDAIDNALFASLDVDCTGGGSIPVSAANMKAYGVLVLTGAPGAAFTLSLGAVNRSLIIINLSGYTATVQAGTAASTVDITNTSTQLVVVDTNDVYTLAGSGGSYSDEAAQDAVGALISAGTQSGIVVTYDDAGAALNFTVSSNSDYQESVRIISTTNITLNGEQTLQSVALVDGDRVLAAGQTTGADRRIWIVRALADWDIAEGWDVTDTVTTNAQCTADEGTYEGQTYRLTTTGTITLGTTSLTWEASESAIAQYTTRNVNGATYTILASDRNKWIYLGRAGTQTITLEEYAVQPMANGSQFVAQYYGTSGDKTITADAAVTLNGTAGGSVTLDTRFDAYIFKQKSRNVWVAVPWKAPAAASYTQEQIEDFIATMFTAGTHSGISYSYDDGAATINATVSGSGITQEQSEDFAAAMFTGGTHDGISFSYNDASGLVNATVKPTECLIIAASDETTALTTGTAKVTFRMPYAFTLTGIRASLTTAGSGTTTVDVNEAGSTIMTTNKLNFDASEKTTTTYSGTAATLTDTSLADDAEITIDIDTAGAGATGLKVYLIGHRT